MSKKKKKKTQQQAEGTRKFVLHKHKAQNCLFTHVINRLANLVFYLFEDYVGILDKIIRVSEKDQEDQAFSYL